jgi:hypothetical protein
VAATVLTVGACSLAGSPAAGASEVVYDNLPASNPGNLPSMAFEATSTSQFGGQVQLAGTARKGMTLYVGMSSWACQKGSWTGSPECVTEMGARFEWPVTLELYEVGAGGAPGALLKSVTRTFKMPYRPSQNNKKCRNAKGEPTGGWYLLSLNQCFHGKYFRIGFPLGRAKLPAVVIVSVLFNTSDYGAELQRPLKPGCETTSGGCPFDSLNVAVTEPANEVEPAPVAPSVGSDPRPADAYLSSTWGGAYCDGGASGTGSFRLDAGCWTGYQPTFEVLAE